MELLCIYINIIQVLLGYKALIPNFPAFLGQLPPKAQEKLIKTYKF
jgi:hypothetical protein